jgi:hypothetical protein
LGIGDWGLGIGDWAQSPIPNPQSPIPNPNPQHSIKLVFKKNNLIYIILIKNRNGNNNAFCKINAFKYKYTK